MEPIFLANKQIDEGTGERLAAWAAGRSAPVTGPIPDPELDAMIDTMDVKTVSELETAFGRAYTRAKKVNDEAAKKKLKSVYDKMKTDIEAGAII